MKAKKTRMQTTVIKKTLLFALLVVTGSAWAEWVKIGETENAYHYVDPATIRKDGNLVRVWELNDLKQRHKDGELSRRYRSEYDCKQELYKMLSISEHSGPMASGTTLTSGIPDAPWTGIPPNSVVEDVLKIVCAK
jgi:hypothetical protein